jgi:hypothetical protein
VALAEDEPATIRFITRLATVDSPDQADIYSIALLSCPAKMAPFRGIHTCLGFDGRVPAPTVLKVGHR